MTAYHSGGDILLHDLPDLRPRLSNAMSSDGNDEEEYRDDDNAQTGLLNGTTQGQKSAYKPAFPSIDSRPTSKNASIKSKIFLTIGVTALCLAIILLGKAANMMETEIAGYCGTQGEKVPEYFQYTKSAFRGPIETGRPPMLAEEDAALHTDGRPGSLEFDVPIEGGNGKDDGSGSIFREMGQLSPWHMDQR